jgi:hypothetical protein
VTSRELLKDKYHSNIQSSVGQIQMSEKDICDMYKEVENKIICIKALRENGPREANYFDGYKKVLSLKEAKEICESILMKHNLWKPDINVNYNSKGVV